MTARKNLCENAACRVASVTCPSCHATFGQSVDRPAPLTAQSMPGTGTPRDPARIDPTLARLSAAWHLRPDLRLGQLLAGSLANRGRADRFSQLFNAECHEFGAAGAPVEWPAPSTAQPPPVLDLDALAEAERAMTAGLSVEAGNVEIGDTGEWDAYVHIVGRDGRVLVYMNSPEADRSLALARGIVALRNAAPHLLAEARTAVALRAQICRLVSSQAIESDRLCQHHDADVVALAEVATLRERLAEAKRLGLLACDILIVDTVECAAYRAALEAL